MLYQFIVFLRLIFWSSFLVNILKFEFQKWHLQTIFLNIKWFQLKKWWTLKMYNSSRSTTFILIIFSFNKGLVNIIHKSTYHSQFHKLYEGHVDLWTMFNITLSDEEMIKIKVVDLVYNFVVYNFSIWNHLMFQNAVLNLIFKWLKNSDLSF